MRPESILLAAFTTLATAQQQAAPPRSFSEYWDRGKAEIARYDLTQSRYGAPRKGHAILVFVTEDFRRDTQVKDERGAAPSQSTRILKLNRIQRFTTGIYDYSMMQSVFTPLDRAREPRTLKTTASVQDWCGHVWAQLNRAGEEYLFTGHSYFESEGDEQFSLRDAVLEDELLNIVRIDPTTLPTGAVRVIPGMFDSRLRHRRPQIETATGSLRDAGAKLRTYSLQYPSGRTLEITFERQLPHGIHSFKETLGRQVTEARRTHVVQSAYWNLSGNGSAATREALGLEPNDIGRSTRSPDPDVPPAKGSKSKPVRRLPARKDPKERGR